MCLGEDLERKIERIYLEECSENPRTVILFYFIWEGYGGINSWKVTIRLPVVGFGGHLVATGPNADISNPGFFPGSDLDEYLESFLKFDWADLDVPRKIWMSSFHNTKENEISMVRSKVMASGSELMCFARFFGHLNRFNSDFNPWIVVGKGIQ